MSGSMNGAGKLLAYLTRTATANSEDDVEELLGLLNPVEDEIEAGRNFEEAIGYNPINYYDRKYANGVLNDILDACNGDLIGTISDESVQRIRDHKDDIIGRIMDCFPKYKAKTISEMIPEFLVDFIDGDDVDKIAAYLGVDHKSFDEAEEEDDPFEEDEDDEDDEDLALSDELFDSDDE